MPGVKVGHETIIRGDGPLVVGEGPVRTGVTVIWPHSDGSIAADPVYAGYHQLNGNGEMTGIAWVNESGLLTSAIAITNTASVGVVRDALIAYDREQLHLRARAGLPPAGRRRDLRRLAERHQRLPCHEGAPLRRGRCGDAAVRSPKAASAAGPA